MISDGVQISSAAVLALPMCSLCPRIVFISPPYSAHFSPVKCSFCSGRTEDGVPVGLSACSLKAHFQGGLTERKYFLCFGESFFLLILHGFQGNICIFAGSEYLLKAPKGGRQVSTIYKGVPLRFGFDVTELRNFCFPVKDKATGTPQRGVLYALIGSWRLVCPASV